MAPDSTYNFMTNSLPSRKLYDKLTHGIQSVSNTVGLCVAYGDNSLSKYPQIKDFCSKLQNYLKNEYRYREQYTIKYEFCNLLSYWLYGQLVNMCNENKCDPKIIYKKISRIFSTSFHYIQSVYNFYNCELDPYINSHDDWEKRKKLYDYCQDCETIKEMYQNNKEYCERYNIYLLDIIKLYDDFKTSCTYRSGTECPVTYDKFYKCTPEKLLQYYSCQAEEVEEDEDPTADTYKEDSQTEFSSPEQNIPINEQNNILSSRLKAISSDERNLMNYNNNSLKIFGNILLGVIVTSLLVGALYKVNTFTAIGNQLRNTIVYRKNKTNHLNKERNKLLNDTSEYLNPYYEDMQNYYVWYSTA
ncbi:variable surface protein [Plasmodium gonderi]|uniref:Variable surface protein n=1 Tax=Plasmodium gonderi TaxID=77519 RepID=A0A1Y1JP68_PLAGO|nr:variable surface protein [Plasmodium gonderi]GAW84386.1 variable surface protein [Plasmodium gonderi]